MHVTHLLAVSLCDLIVEALNLLLERSRWIGSVRVQNIDLKHKC